MRRLGEEMPSGCWIAVLLLLLPAVTQAQSGDGDADVDSRISCTSDIMTDGSSLTCKLVEGRNDNEDDEDYQADGIENMTACFTDFSTTGRKCVNNFGDTVSSRDLSLVVDLNVTIHLKRGGQISKTIDLKKIVKPRSPQVWNVTVSRESQQALIHIRTPYHKEYLKVDNQLFQLLIWSAHSSTIQNISSSDHVVMKIDMQQLQKHTQYHVRVRAIPQKHLQGTWSEWSETFSFTTPADKQTNPRQELYTLSMCLVPLFVVTSAVVLFWKNKIFTYMWPRIPYPKHTLMQICQPNKGLLLNFKPEVFSALKVYPMEKAEEHPCEETVPSVIAAAAGGTQSNLPCSTQTSDCSTSTTSISTEELELSALLSDREDSVQTTSPSPTQVLQLGERPDTPQPECSSGGNEAEVFRVSQQDEAYVTMSSFYQIK
uniref:interleukin-7 receptor subunit alpha isoform X2 n=1 Tax=Scatophagus argus TaxID=75038 RepID=UPI001ED85544|nr:interleukin-7 receptor subunit alpha isoform X2 [Scatophagus argus]